VMQKQSRRASFLYKKNSIHEQVPMVSARLMSRAYSMPTHEGSRWLGGEEGKFKGGGKWKRQAALRVTALGQFTRQPISIFRNSEKAK